MSQPDTRLHLLLIDDDPDQLEIMGASFERKEYLLTFETANNPEEALELINRNDFDCIVCNYIMPRLNGLQLCEKLRRTGVETPFILFTSNDDEKVVQTASMVGVDDYIMKSSEIAVYDLLVRRAQELVTQHRD